MTRDEVRELLDRAGIFGHACDLDLLLFFVAHSRSLLASESLAAYLGYELKQIADSLEVLLAAGLLKRTQTSAHAARLYVLEAGATNHEWLPRLLEIASTRQGRAALRKTLARRAGEAPGGSVVLSRPDTMVMTDPRSFVVLDDHRRVVVRKSRTRGGR